MPVASQLGVKDEATWGTAVTVDRFFEYISEGIESDFGRIESRGLRANERVIRQDRFAVGGRSFAGAIEMEWLTKSMGWWLKHMLGTVTTSAIVDSCYTHTATVASLFGDSFTAQVNRPFNPSGTDQAFTYEGGKIASWEISCEVDGLLGVTLDADFEDSSTAVGLAAASYTSGMEVMPYTLGTVTIAGAVVSTESFSCKVDNGLRTDKRHLGAATKREQVENARRTIEAELLVDFDSLTQYNRIGSLVAAGALASLVATFRGPTLAGTATYPSLTVTIPQFRFDGQNPSVGGEEALMQTLTGVGLTPTGGTSPITLAYVSVDSTP